MALRAWGQLPAEPAAAERWLTDRSARLPVVETTMLAYGNGRSYGDVGLNSGGTLLHTRGLDRFIAFDGTTGVLTCEAGVLLSEILDLFVPRGWFLPVTPGTRFVTVQIRSDLWSGLSFPFVAPSLSVSACYPQVS